MFLLSTINIRNGTTFGDRRTSTLSSPPETSIKLVFSNRRSETMHTKHSLNYFFKSDRPWWSGLRISVPHFLNAFSNDPFTFSNRWPHFSIRNILIAICTYSGHKDEKTPMAIFKSFQQTWYEAGFQAVPRICIKNWSILLILAIITRRTWHVSLPSLSLPLSSFCSKFRSISLICMHVKDLLPVLSTKDTVFVINARRIYEIVSDSKTNRFSYRCTTWYVYL